MNRIFSVIYSVSQQDYVVCSELAKQKNKVKNYSRGRLSSKLIHIFSLSLLTLAVLGVNTVEAASTISKHTESCVQMESGKCVAEHKADKQKNATNTTIAETNFTTSFDPFFSQNLLLDVSHSLPANTLNLRVDPWGDFVDKLRSIQQSITNLRSHTHFHYISINGDGSSAGNYNNDGAQVSDAIALGSNATAGSNGTSMYQRYRGNPFNGYTNNPSNLAPYGQDQVLQIGGFPGTQTAAPISIGAYTKSNGAGISLGYGASTNIMGVAIGALATADSSSISIGAGAFTQGNTSIALGRQAAAIHDYSIALGNVSAAADLGSLAMGHSATAKGYRAIAIGAADIRAEQNTSGNDLYGDGEYYAPQNLRTFATGDGAIAFGATAQATGTNNIAFGSSSVVNGNDNVAMGHGAQAQANQALAFGFNAIAGQNDTNQTQTTTGNGGVSAVAIGSGAHALGDSTLAIGAGSQALASNSLLNEINSLGQGQQQLDGKSIAIGDTSSAIYDESIAIGANAQAGVNTNNTSAQFNGEGGIRSVAIGSHATTTFDNSVAIGSGSVTTVDAGVQGYDIQTGSTTTQTTGAWQSTAAAVAVGNGTQVTRQITGVAAGTNDTDAVNVAQLKRIQTSYTGDNTTTIVTRTPSQNLQILGGASGDTIADGIKTIGNENGSISIQLAQVLNGLKTVGVGNITINSTKGIDAGNLPISHIPDTPTSGDQAVNRNYVWGLGWELSNNGNSVGNVSVMGNTVNFKNGKGTLANTTVGSDKSFDVSYDVNVDGKTITINKSGQLVANASESPFQVGGGTGKPITINSDNNQFNIIGAADGDIITTVNGNNIMVDLNKATKTALKNAQNHTFINKATLGEDNKLTLDYNNDTKPISVDLSSLKTQIKSGNNVTITGNGTLNSPYSVNVATTSLSVGNGAVNDPDAGASQDLVTAGNIVNVLNGLGIYMEAQSANPFIVNPGGTVNFTNGDNNILVSSDGSSSINFNLSNQIHLTQGTISGIANNINFADAGSVRQRGSNAASLNDVLRMGWILQANGKKKLQVNPYSTVNFENGNGTTISIRPAGPTAKVKYDVNVDGTTIKVNSQNQLTADLSSAKTVLVSGSNTTLSGDGTATNPYKVNVADMHVKSGAMAYNDQGEGTLTLTSGDGTTTTITGVDNTFVNKATLGSDNKLSLTYNNGQAPLSVDLSGLKAHMVAGSNTTLDGDGTATNPYKVNVADMHVKSGAMSYNDQGEGTLTLTSGDGTTTTITGVDNTFVNKATLGSDNKLSLAYNNGQAPLSVDLSGLKAHMAAGTNTTLSGNGTAINPYKVNVEDMHVKSGAMAYNDQGAGTLTLTSGDGTKTTITGVDNTFVNKATLGSDDKLSLDYNNGQTPLSVDLSGLKAHMTAGTNTILTGNGTQDNPFIVNVATTPLTISNGKVMTPATTDAGKLATAGDIAKALNGVGFNIEGNGASPEFISSGATVNFVNGNATTATVSKEGTTPTVKYDVAVDNDTIKIENGKLTATVSAGDLDLHYKANSKAPDNSVSLAEGLNFMNGANTTAKVEADGKVTYSVNPALTNIKSISNGTGGKGATITLGSAEKTVDVSGSRITNVGTPTSGTDAVNKNYVDGQTFGFSGNSGKTTAKLNNTIAVTGTKDSNGIGIQTTASDTGLTIGLTDATQKAIADGQKHTQVLKGTNVTSITSGAAKDGAPTYTVNVDDMRVKSGTVSYSADGAGTATLQMDGTHTATITGLKDTYVNGATFDASKDELTLNHNDGKNPVTVDLSGLKAHMVAGTNTTLDGDGTATSPYKVNVADMHVKSGAMAYDNNGQGTLTLTSGDGTTTTITGVDNTFVNKATLGSDDKLSLDYNNGQTPLSVDLSGLKAHMTAGTNTTLTGNGTQDNPFIVNVATTPLTISNGKVMTPATTDAGKLATSGDIAKALNGVGFNIEGNGASPEFISSGVTVNFVNGNATTATVSKEGTTPTVKYDVNVDGSTIKIVGDKLTANVNAGNLKLSYKANADKTSQSVSLSEGLDFMNGTNTIAKVEADGKVTYSVNPALTNIKSISNGTDGKGATITLGNTSKTVDFGGSHITNVGIPTADSDAVNKGYVDGQTFGLTGNSGKATTQLNKTIAVTGVKDNSGIGIQTTASGTGLTIGLTEATQKAIADGQKHTQVLKGTNVTSITAGTAKDGSPTYTVNVADMRLKSGTVTYGKDGAGTATLQMDGNHTATITGLKDTYVNGGSFNPENDTLTLTHNDNSNPVAINLSGLRINIVNGDSTTVEGNGSANDPYRININTGDVTITPDGKAQGPSTLPSDQIKTLKDNLNKAHGGVTSAENALNSANKALAGAKTPAEKQQAQAKVMAAQNALKAAQDALTKAQNAYNGAGLNKVATAQSVADAINHSGFNVQAAANGGELIGSANKTIVHNGALVKFEAGKNLQIQQNGQNFTYSLNPKIEVQQVTVKGTDPNDNGVTITSGVGSDKTPTLQLGSQNKPVRIANVADGTAPNDAVNHKQLEQVVAGITNKAINFGGDSGKAVSTKLGDTLNIQGGVKDPTKLTDGNIGVVTDPTTHSLKVKLAKDLKDLGSVQLTDAKGKPNIKLDGQSGTIAGLTNTKFDPNNINPSRAASEGEVNDVYNAAKVKTKVTAGKGGVIVDNIGTEQAPNYQISIDPNQIAQGTNIHYRANGGTVQSVSLDTGFNFTNGTNTTAVVGKDGNVTYNINPDLSGINSISNGVSGTGAKITLDKGDKNISVNGGKVTGVADGTVAPNSTDAVNGKQLYQTQQQIVANKNAIATNAQHIADNASNIASNKQSIAQNTQKITDNSNKIAQNTQKIDQVKNHIDQVAGDIDKNSQAIKKGINIAGNAGNGDQALGSTVNIVGSAKAQDSSYSSDNITTTYTQDKDGNGTVKVEMKEKPTFKGVEVTDSQGKNKVSISTTSTRYQGDKDAVPTVSLSGGTDKDGKVVPVRIEHVADGVRDDDAANMGQVRRLAQGVSNGFTKLSEHVNDVDKHARAGIASAGAIATLPQAIYAGRSQVAAAITQYRGQSALAIGYSTVSDNSKWTVRFTGSTNTQKDTMVGVGAGYSW
ncbi:hypothetical protein A6A19_03915 [Actinobacillus delphinicola]|uniref:YadA-like family protein n=1 Tax=Actinobacillus delphinicola TaxID=51161 RepID=UPI0024413486|nr:YadA-like family protein [Actinobacillus delphinicola]MDG6897164.1 hypothetical protein [Actinobacillus delphinicola]